MKNFIVFTFFVAFYVSSSKFKEKNHLEGFSLKFSSCLGSALRCYECKFPDDPKCKTPSELTPKVRKRLEKENILNFQRLSYG